MMERLAEQEMEAAAAEEETAVKLEHERRRAAAVALLNQHNPDWFASEISKDEDGSRRGSEDSKAGHRKQASSVGAGHATGDEKLDVAAAVARQRALAKAILNDHNSDWFGELETTTATSGLGSAKTSFFRRIGPRRRTSTSKSTMTMGKSDSPPAGDSPASSSSLKSPSPTPSATPTPPPRPSSFRIRSESPPSSLIQRQRLGFVGRNFGRGGPKGTNLGVTSRADQQAQAAAPGAPSSGKLERHRSSPWFSRTARSESSCPATPASVTSRSGDIGGDGSALTPTPLIQSPLMDVLENKSEEPMSLRSMLRFARENLMEENILFYLEVSSFKTGGGGRNEYLTHVKRIHGLYVKAGSVREINISGDIRNSTTASVDSVLRANGNHSTNSSINSSTNSTQRDENVDGMENVEQEGEGEGQGGSGVNKVPDGSAAAAAAAPGAATTTTPEADLGGQGGKEGQEAAGPEAPLEIAITGVTGIRKLAGSGGASSSESFQDQRAHPSGSTSPTFSSGSGSGSGSSPPLPPRPPPRTCSGTPDADGGRGPADSNETSVQEEGGGGGGGEAGEEDRSRSGSPRTPGGGRGGGLEEGGAEDCSEEIRVRRDSTGMFNSFDRSDDYVNADAELHGFDASGAIEELGLGIGPGGGYGNRTIFDLALLEIFVVLRHEVYPKFVARVMERSRQTSQAAAAAAETASTPRKSIRKTKKSSLSGSKDSKGTKVTSRNDSASPPPMETHSNVSLSESDEVAKARRSAFSRRK